MVMNEKEAKRWHLLSRVCPSTAMSDHVLLVQLRDFRDFFPTSAARTSQKKSIARFPMWQARYHCIHDLCSMIILNRYCTIIGTRTYEGHTKNFQFLYGLQFTLQRLTV